MIGRLARWMQRRRWWILAYILLLAASNIFVLIPGTDAWTPPDSRVAAGAERIDLEVPAMRDGGAIPERSTTVSVLRWTPSTQQANPNPVILLHGSPAGGATDYAKLGPKLAERGYDTIAIDFPGFGHSDAWVPGYSIIANARYTLAVMDRLGIDRAHEIGRAHV